MRPPAVVVFLIMLVAVASPPALTAPRLDRAAAAKMIQAQISANAPVVVFQVGELRLTTLSFGRPAPEDERMAKVFLDILRRHGFKWFTLEISRGGAFNELDLAIKGLSAPDRWRNFLRFKSRIEGAGTPFQKQITKATATYKKVDVRVTGMRVNSKNGCAEYTYQWVAFDAPFEAFVNEMLRFSDDMTSRYIGVSPPRSGKGAALFALFDDGWRLRRGFDFTYCP